MKSEKKKPERVVRYSKGIEQKFYHKKVGEK
jgi:hypothetical protein